MSRLPGKAGVAGGECAAVEWVLGVDPAAWKETPAAPLEVEEVLPAADPAAEGLGADLAEVAAVSEVVAERRVVGAAIAPR